jgi:thioredoxin 1
MDSNMGPSGPKPSSYDTGIKYEEAMNANKPVVIYFYSDACGACVREAPVYDSVRTAYQDKATFVMVDAYEEPQLTRDYGVTGFPSIYLVNPANQERIEIPYNLIGDQQSFSSYLDTNLEQYKPEKKVFLY